VYDTYQLTDLAIASNRAQAGVTADAYKVTFSALAAAETVELGGLTLTVASGQSMTGAEVATAFANLQSGQANPANGTKYTFTGNFSGYNSAVADGASVTFTSLNSRNPLLASSGTASKASVSVVGSNVITIGASAGKGLEDISISVKAVADAGKFTLTANDDTGIGGLSQTVDMGTIAAGGSKLMMFDKLGVTFTLNNARDVSVGSSDFEVFSSSVNTLSVDAIGAGNAMFQVGAATRDVVSVDGFKDIRITGYNKNSGEEASVFDRLNATLNTIAANTTESLSSENFATLENQIEDVITTVADFRSYFGAQQNRIEFAISNLQAQSENLTAANSRIRDTDYAAETATLTKTQIMQQAATAMLAQANQMPNVILALLK
jgi:flagellin